MTGNTKGSLIEEKFRNKTIFLTGATGFYGGNLVHLFMSLRIKALCCLVRGADGAKRICGGMYANDSRLIVFEGDMSQSCLGLSTESVKGLENQIDFFIHSAANTSFTADIQTMYQDNVSSCMNVAIFGFITCKVSQFIFISSCWVNLVDNMGTTIARESIKDVSKSLDELRVNAYIHSKANCERMLHHLFSGYGIPLLIARIPTIAHAVAIPYSGYMTKSSPMFAILFGNGDGPSDANVEYWQDVIPVDIAANLLVTCVAYLDEYQGAKVVHLGSGRNRLHQKVMFDNQYKIRKVIPSELIDRVYNVFVRNDVLNADDAIQNIVSHASYREKDAKRFPVTTYGGLSVTDYMMLPKICYSRIFKKKVNGKL